MLRYNADFCWRLVVGKLPYMQDRMRGKTENQHHEEKEKGTNVENSTTEKISNNKILAVKQ